MDINEFLENQTIEIPQEMVVEPQESQPEDYTEEQLAEVFELIKDVQKNNGYTAIARKTKVAKHVVKQMHIEYMQKVAEKLAQQAMEKMQEEENMNSEEENMTNE